ncbi:hypothetical protein Avbf_07070 [Armadillidium vulgare]|nr:hypothetical protein Avbf_07070 [Armadillidium vulgare]
MYPDFKNCSKPELTFKFIQKRNYWVLQNYIKSSRRFRCDESITFTTIGEIGFLNNLFTVIERWQGPISITVYAPGTSFEKTLETIFHLRDCGQNDVKKFVTFHLFFDFHHMPEKIPNLKELFNYKVNCTKRFSDLDIPHPYRKENGLLYPINLARNVARSKY